MYYRILYFMCINTVYTYYVASARCIMCEDILDGHPHTLLLHRAHDQLYCCSSGGVYFTAHYSEFMGRSGAVEVRTCT